MNFPPEDRQSSRTWLSGCSILVLLAFAPVPLRSQDESLRLQFSGDQVHIQNAALERLVSILPHLRPNDFVRTYSPFDSVVVSPDDPRLTPLVREDLRYRFGSVESVPSLGFSASQNRISVEPVLGLRANVDRNGIESWTKSIGFKAEGSLGSSLVFSMRFVDDGTRGKVLDQRQTLRPTDGFVVSNDYGTNGFDFDETEGQLGYRRGDAQIFLEKVRNIWGYGNDGQVILSRKAPSYPQLRLSIPVTDRLKFTYIHAALYSDVVDSLQSYGSAAHWYTYRKVFRSKYFVSHVLEYAPSDALNFALGESMVYSDRFEPAYLIPILLFRSIERQTRDSDNAQLFAAMRWTVQSFGSLYVDLFIDDLNTNRIFSPENDNIVAGTIGGRFFDAFVPNLDLALEYSRMNPWVYTHQYEATAYTTNMYTLGHWLGQNSDCLFFSAEYRWVRSLSVGLTAQHFRYGPLGPESIHYTTPWKQRFLEGPAFRQTQVGIHARWEPWRNLLLNAEVLVATQHDDVPLRYESYSNRMLMNLGVAYNFFTR